MSEQADVEFEQLIAESREHTQRMRASLRNRIADGLPAVRRQIESIATHIEAMKKPGSVVFELAIPGCYLPEDVDEACNRAVAKTLRAELKKKQAAYDRAAKVLSDLDAESDSHEGSES